ncbi:MAG: ABC transporter permease [Vicinamibacteria bacterium]|nr:ABC transporter permease [Vicinamibacteria bacterium]
MSGRLSFMIAKRFPLLFGVTEAIGQGFAGIRAYKLRAGLTILGVVMGIMTVTGMSSIVAGLNASMASQIEALGSSVIFIRPQAPGEHLTGEEGRRRKGLSLDEVAKLSALPLVKAFSPLELLRIDTIKYGAQKIQDTTVIGTSQDYETVHDHFVARGRFLNAGDVERGSSVVVLGGDVADALFPFLEPVDKEITLDGRRFRVVGVLERKGKFLGQSRDNFLLIPLGSFQKKDARFNFMVADIKPISPARLDDTVEQVREGLRRARKIRYLDKDTFAVFTQDTFVDLYRQLTGGIYLVMIAISSIGLVVGGVGVMNIMLVSVTERTREIGVRKALGARKRDILWQFLTEAMTLTGAGGLLGIAIGGLAATLINTFSPFPAVLQPTWIAVAFFTSLGVGLGFGLWPAWKAASLDPIEALRYE